MITLATTITNTDTGEVIHHRIDDYDFDIKAHKEYIKVAFRIFFDKIRKVEPLPSHDCFSIEFRTYRSHQELELPF